MKTILAAYWETSSLAAITEDDACTLRANSNALELLTHTELAGLVGSQEAGVESVAWRTRNGEPHWRPIRHVFLFLGAEPSTGWLKDQHVAVDDKGFVTTGRDVSLPLQTNVPGVFAIGDVRAGSVKRVGGAIGEGAAVVSQIHAYLARRLVGSPTTVG